MIRILKCKHVHLFHLYAANPGDSVYGRVRKKTTGPPSLDGRGKREKQTNHQLQKNRKYIHQQEKKKTRYELRIEDKNIKK